MAAGERFELFLAGPGEAPHQWIRLEYRIDDITVHLFAPRDPDQLLDDPGVQRASVERDYMPYWAYVWSSSVVLARHVVELDQGRLAGLRVLELGCGLGLPGLVAAKLGARVTFNDLSPLALEAVAASARANGVQPAGLIAGSWQDLAEASFDLVLGADVLYEIRCAEELARVLPRLVACGGLGLLVDPMRSTADRFLGEVASHPELAVDVADGARENGHRHRVIRVRRWARNRGD